MSEQSEYFFEALDLYFIKGKSPKEALERTMEDYQFVFHVKDGRRPFNRAAELALRHLEEESNDA